MSHRRILIVDDNEDLTAGLAMILEDEGCQVETAHTCEAARTLHADAFDLLLIDAKLPDCNGLRMCRDIRAQHPASRLIIMTGFRLEQLVGETTGSRQVSVLQQGLSLEQIASQAAELISGDIALLGNTRASLQRDLLQALSQQDITAEIYRQGENLPSADRLLILPGATAVDTLLSYITMEEALAQRRVVLLFGDGRDTLLEDNALRALDMTGCLFKPFKPEQLLQALETLNTT